MRRALFLKTKHIGDSIVLTSAIAALPDDYIVDVLCFRDSAEIFQMSPRVRDVFVVPRHLNGWARLRQDWSNFRRMSSQGYDLLAQFSDDWRGSFISRVLRVKLSVARYSRKRPAFWTNAFSCIAKSTTTPRPAAEQDVDLLRRVNLYSGKEAPAYQLEVSEQYLEKVRKWLVLPTKVGRGKLVVIHAAARWKFKGLPNQTWAKVIDGLIDRGFIVVLSGSAADLEFNKSLIGFCETPPKLVTDFTLPETSALVQLADLVISIDSMMIHLASALQTPVVALFGPTDDRVWAPWKVPHRVVAVSQQESPSFVCRPCGLDGCGGSKTSQCLYAIAPSTILAATESLLNR
jgi:heptosyltransferase-3